MDDSIPCWVYRCARKQEMYLYLGKKDDFDSLPAELKQATGELTLVMELELSADRKLAREDVEAVMRHLDERGFHLQMPPHSAPTTPLWPDIGPSD